MKATVLVRLKREVLDPQGDAVRRALGTLGFEGTRDVRVGKLIEIDLGAHAKPGPELEARLRQMADSILANPVIEDYEIQVGELRVAASSPIALDSRLASVCDPSKLTRMDGAREHRVASVFSALGGLPVTTTLLAVDDSVTMRKVLEITFAGEDFRVVTAESADAALKKARADKPQIVVLDVSLPEMDGYAVCKTLKAEMPGVAVVLLSSKQGPYDAGRGSAAGADDFIDKPFDTQQMIDKVRKVAAARAAQPQTAPPPGATAKPAAPEPPKAAGTLPGAGHAPMVPAPPAPRPQAASAPNRTQMFAGAPPMPAATPAPAPRPVATAPVASPPTPASGVARPAPSPAAPPVAPVAAAAAPAPSPVAAAVNGQLGDKLAGLGLSQAQADAVLALSREVVERIVWEVVPVLAETMIKEEIRRLTRDEA